MKLQVPFLQLPVSFDAEALAAEITALSEDAWRPHPQGFAGNSAIPLVARDGDPGSDAVSGPMQPTPQLLSCPYLMQTMAIIGGVWGRSRLMRLSGNAEVQSHVDVDYYWREHVRVHVPIVTQPEVRFECGSSAINMAAGECWLFDTWSRHRVLNSADRSRIHLVADTVGGAGFWNLVAGARVPKGGGAGWQAQRIEPQHGAEPTLVYESTNVPIVMTPWEVKEHLTFVLDDALPHPRLGEVHQLVGHFARHWRSLWAAHGESASGFAEYRAALDQLKDSLREVANGIVLENGSPLALAMRRLVIDVAVNDVGSDTLADERSSMTATAAM
ncbi:MAG: aspartyl/asparaginyl beta-hydroxylase domain-containing protein [Dokdonella sp.]